MTNLTFAIEAARRGCPYVKETRFDGFSLWTFEFNGSSFEISRAEPHERFAMGATLALWWDERKETQMNNQDEYWLCNTMAADARSFAKGL